MKQVTVYSRRTEQYVKISPHFTVNEFASKDGAEPVFISGDLVAILEKIREKFGPVTISSGYRSPTHNNKIGGAAQSQHLYGCAADIQVKNATPDQVAEYVETLLPNKGGIGRYKNFTHIDVRDKKSRWKG